MGAAYTKLVNDISIAHKPPQTWDSCAAALSAAIHTYMQAGVGHTNVTGVVVPPSGSSYSATGIGIESAKTTPGYSVMTQAIIAAYHNPVWAGLGAKIASGIITYVAAVVITTTVSGTLVGVGANGKLTSSQSSTLSSALNSLFINQNTWEAVSTQIASAIRDYFDSLILQTVDSGTVPPASWAGAGVGNMQWS